MQPELSQVVSVSTLVRSVRDTIESRFPLMWVAGEISGWRPAASGHVYFSLKDEQAQVDCVMWRNRAAHLGWQPRDGARVQVRALATMYEPRGRFQLSVETMREAGLGPLYERFLRLKSRLEQEGVFDAAAKRPLPEFPRAIGVVTSLAAAALRDVLSTLARRNPSIPVIVYPAPVQGEGAAAKIAAMIEAASRRAEVDVILLVRGGGSIEDLWQFNEEAVARAIRASGIPVVVGVGHETDFTIADFAADERAPTPTAAAERVSPSREALVARAAELALRLSRGTARVIEYGWQRTDALARRLVHPRDRLRGSAQLVAQLAARVATAARHALESARHDLARLRAGLSNLDPGAVLARGYSLTRNSRGDVLLDAAQLAEGETVVTTLARGSFESEVRRRK
ncbi:MAG: exodeoxyribonuclease VII large subunit [Burkholderiales bacterium]